MLIPSDGLEMIDGQAGADPRQDPGLFVQPILGDEDRDRLAVKVA
mgnify:CR=1 FL=1